MKGRGLILLSLAWGALILCSNLVRCPLAVWLTSGLILWNFGASTWTLFRKKRISVALNLVQILLFVVLHCQVFCALGAHHYLFARTPGLWDWCEFTAAHVLRAADLLDFLEAYEIDLHHIKHYSVQAGVLLVTMHVTVGFFLAGMVACWLLSWWRRLRERSLEEKDAGKRRAAARALVLRLKRWHVCATAACVLGGAGLAGWRGWQMSDWLLWPADQLLRTVDVAGAMHIFGWRLHGVEHGWDVATLGLVLRFLAGSYLARWGKALHVRLLGQQALRTLDEFIEDLHNEDERVRETAILALGRQGVEARAAAGPLIEALSDDSWRVCDAARWAVRRIGAPPADAVPDLVVKLADRDWVVRRAAADALSLLGPRALAAVPALIECLADRDRQLETSAARALARIYPAWYEGNLARAAVPALIGKLQDRDRHVRQAAADVLCTMGQRASAAVPALLRNSSHKDEYVRLSAQRALDRIEPDWRFQLTVATE